MFVDASAIVAILAAEDDATELSARFVKAEHVITSPVAIYEAVLGLARSRKISVIDAETAIHDLLARAKVEIVPITEEIARTAIRAFERYGRGRHPAQLNMGDCFAYACARALGVPLLYKGDDFSRTDIAAG
ncbi:MAG: type II toxin-antitoxin system VapC family toxin [Alphaproteobacteria bacterium]